MSNIDDLIKIDVSLKDNNTLKINIIPFKRSIQRFVLMSVKPELLKVLGQPINADLIYSIKSLVRARVHALINSGCIIDKKIVLSGQEYHDWKMAEGMDDYLESPLESWGNKNWEENE